MPVSFRPCNHPAETYPSDSEEIFDTPGSILAEACPDQFEISERVLQSSFNAHIEEDIIPKSNGFVNAVTEAYNYHRALVLRPDDVWIAIITQFHCLINGAAEQLRSKFVDHDGKKELVIEGQGSRNMADFGGMARSMTELIENNITDPTLRQWILPDFSTTTANDIVVSSIITMSTMKRYFSYTFRLKCGIPHVTLEGEKCDWERILFRLEKLKEFGLHAIAWHHLISPIISRFVKAFDDPHGAENADFWQKVAHYKGRGSGREFLAGWITAFCVFNEEGQWIGDPITETHKTCNPASLSPSDFWSAYVTASVVPHLSLDGASYPAIDTSSIPCGHAEIDVKLDDNGVEIETMLTAGLVGIQILSSGETKFSVTGERDTVRPIIGWWIFIKAPASSAEDSSEL